MTSSFWITLRFVSQEARNMKGWMVALAATVALSLAPAQANAGFCGVARYSCCGCCCPQTHTVMKTVHCMEYEQQEFTCYKTCWDRVCEDRIINCVKYVPETHSREVCYTVSKPCWETKTCNYTVCKPCFETKSREICYTVCKPCWETKTRCYTTCKPCWEDHSKEVCYTVCKPCWETKTRTYTVCKPCWETKSKEVCYTVCKPVWEERTRTY